MVMNCDDGHDDEDKHNLRRRKYVNCIKRKVYINFAQVTKLALLHDDDNDDNDDNNDNDDNDDNDDYDDDDDDDNDDDNEDDHDD